VPIEVVEHGILLGCTRKYMPLLTTPDSGLIVSLTYFQNGIEEATGSRVTSDYRHHLSHRVDGVGKEWLQKVPSRQAQ
jgi:hypothetical protein